MNIESLTKQLKKVAAKYAKDYGIEMDEQWHLLKLQEELGELVQSYLMLKGQARQKGKTAEQLREDMEDEIADTLCMLLLFADTMDVDLTKVLDRTWLSYPSKPKVSSP